MRANGLSYAVIIPGLTCQSSKRSHVLGQQSGEASSMVYLEGQIRFRAATICAYPAAAHLQGGADTVEYMYKTGSDRSVP